MTKRESGAALEAYGVLSGRLNADSCEYLGKEPQRRNRSAGSESKLVYEIMRAVGKHGAVYRMNAGQIKLESGRIFRGLPAGFSDIMVILPGGRVSFIEAKVKPNRPTEAQLKFIEKMQGLGCGAGVAYSIDEALRICGLCTSGCTSV